MSEFLDWSDELAMQIIADVHGNNFMTARKIIAGRLRVVQQTETQAVFARMRLMAADARSGPGLATHGPNDDVQYDADVERREGWTI